MAKKKKKRYKRNGKATRPKNNVKDTHHLCYQRNRWQKGYLRALRDYWYCRICIPRDTLHRQIHLELPAVPPPANASAKSALEQLGYLEQYGSITEFDSIERRLGVLAALFDCTDQETADAFRTQLRIVREYKASSK